MTTANVRVRFAPSPTGFLHIGTTRTALFNWLFAKAEKGVFVLRIEDTDRERSKKEYLDEILNDLKWLGLSWDEGPYFQSERQELYKKHVDKLLSAGLAYEDDGAVKFKVPRNEKISVSDVIHGEIHFDTDILKDIVIIKSDGTPTYNFACVVDDAEMRITHIIRGDDHISNTPKQVLLYAALGFALPLFAHIPLILDEERAKLSKRQGAESLSYYCEQGFLPEALANYLILLGWSPGENREIIPLEEAAALFSLERINKTAAAFGLDKLKWVNKMYIKSLPVARLAKEIIPFLEKKGYSLEARNNEWLEEIVTLYQERFETFADFVEQAGFFWTKDIEYAEDAKAKLEDKNILEALRTLRRRFKELPAFDTTGIEAVLRTLAKELSLSLGKIAQPLRAAVTGRTVSPGIFEVVSLLGKEKTVKRLDEALEIFCGNP